MHFRRHLNDNSKDDRSCLRSSDMLACMLLVSMIIPKNYRRVDGPLIFDDFTGGLMCLQKESMVVKLLEQSLESGEPAVKKSSR